MKGKKKTTNQTEVEDYGKSPVPLMDNFDTIMHKYNAIGNTMSIRRFHREYVKVINPKISLHMWHVFMAKFNKRVMVKVDKLLKAVEGKAAQDIVMEEQSMRKMLAIFNLSLDEVINNPELLAQIPLERRADWFFKTMRARDSRAKVAIKKRADDREQTAYDELMTQAQYSGDVIDVENAPSGGDDSADQTSPEKEEVERVTSEEAIDEPLRLEDEPNPGQVVQFEENPEEEMKVLATPKEVTFNPDELL